MADVNLSLGTSFTQNVDIFTFTMPSFTVIDGIKYSTNISPNNASLFTLDYAESNFLMPSDTLDYVNLSGSTMSGDLVIPSLSLAETPNLITDIAQGTTNNNVISNLGYASDILNLGDPVSQVVKFIYGFYTAPQSSDGELSSSLVIAPGECSPVAGTNNISSNVDFIKTTSSLWSPGNGAGGMPPNIVINSGFYSVFVLGNALGGFDVGFDNNPNATNLLATATEFTTYRRIAYVYITSSAGNFLSYTQTGNRFEYTQPVEDYNQTASVPDGYVDNVTLTVPPSSLAILSPAVTTGGVVLQFTNGVELPVVFGQTAIVPGNYPPSAVDEPAGKPNNLNPGKQLSETIIPADNSSGCDLYFYQNGNSTTTIVIDTIGYFDNSLLVAV